MAHVNKPVPLPSQLGVVLPPGVEAALLRALAKKPEDRFARSGDFVRALAGSQFSVPTPAPTTFPAPTSPSQPPIVAAAGVIAATPVAGAPSPLLSPSGLVSGVARVEPPPPAEPIPVAPALAGGAATAVIAAPKARGGFPWRRAIVPAILVLVLAVLALRGGSERNAAVDRTNAPVTATVRTTTAPTVAPTVAPTTAPTVAPTTAPTARPTFGPTAPTTVAEIEPNNTPATATAMAAGSVHDGTISPAGDVDYYRAQVPDNTAMLVTLHADSLPGGGVAIFNAAGVEVAPEVITGADKIARAEYVVRDPGAYFIRARAVRETTGTYQLSYQTAAR